MNQATLGIIFLVLMFVLMYVLMVRPQKKKEKEVNAMRNALTVGDQIITIGGICGKIVKTKDETIIVQVGADKTKFEMMRWSVSRVVDPAVRAPEKEEEPEEEEEAAPKRPKRLRTKADLEAENARLAEERAAAEEENSEETDGETKED
ncbi:MAG: preprotein translocase subunit YajC [Anaerovoracaceae bacterium]|nr:preprotein translocase subunit YajC [Anaerovoracaceae bacterium]